MYFVYDLRLFFYLIITKLNVKTKTQNERKI